MQLIERMKSLKLMLEHAKNTNQAIEKMNEKQTTIKTQKLETEGLKSDLEEKMKTEYEWLTNKFENLESKLIKLKN
jgi:catalase (peroxidase I)